MLARWGIRLGTSLVAIAAGIIISMAVLSDFSANATAVVEATLLFWLIHLVIQFIALKIFIKEPSIALAGLLALASTIVALVLVNLIVSDVTIRGATTYLIAALIIWITTAAGDMVARRMILDRRADRRA